MCDTLFVLPKQVNECRINHGIEVKGECPPPIENFAELHLPPHAMAELHRLGYEASENSCVTAAYSFGIFSPTETNTCTDASHSLYIVWSRCHCPCRDCELPSSLFRGLENLHLPLETVPKEAEMSLQFLFLGFWKNSCLLSATVSPATSLSSCPTRCEC